MSAVSDSKHVVLIHGTWANGDIFGDARREFEARGYAVHTRHAGLVAATPAPAAGIFATYPGTIRVFSGHYLQRRPWTEPLIIRRRGRRSAGTSPTPPTAACATSTPYWSVSLAGLTARWGTGPRPQSGPRVDFAAVTTPVLAIGARRDRLVHRRVARATAKRYANGAYVEIPASDHLVFHGNALPVTMTASSRPQWRTAVKARS